MSTLKNYSNKKSYEVNIMNITEYTPCLCVEQSRIYKKKKKTKHTFGQNRNKYLAKCLVVIK